MSGETPPAVNDPFGGPRDGSEIGHGAVQLTSKTPEQADLQPASLSLSHRDRCTDSAIRPLDRVVT